MPEDSLDISAQPIAGQDPDILLEKISCNNLASHQLSGLQVKIDCHNQFQWQARQNIQWKDEILQKNKEIIASLFSDSVQVPPPKGRTNESLIKMFERVYAQDNSRRNKDGKNSYDLLFEGWQRMIAYDPKLGKTHLQMIHEYCMAERFPFELLPFLALAESHWKPNALSSKKAAGYLQFMPKTWEAWGTKDDNGMSVDMRNDPVESVKAGIRYLKWCYRKTIEWDTGKMPIDKEVDYKESRRWHWAMWIYNSGPGRSTKGVYHHYRKNKDPMYYPKICNSTESKQYVPKIYAIREVLKKQMPSIANVQIAHSETEKLPRSNKELISSPRPEIQVSQNNKNQTESEEAQLDKEAIKESVVYRMHFGDRVADIAFRLCGYASDRVIKQIKMLNPSLNINRIRSGQRIRIPAEEIIVPKTGVAQITARRYISGVDPHDARLYLHYLNRKNPELSPIRPGDTIIAPLVY